MVPTSEGLGRQETGRGKDREKEEEACFPREQCIHEKFLSHEISLFRTLSPTLILS